MAHSTSLLGLKKHLKKALFELKDEKPELVNQLIESNARRKFLKTKKKAKPSLPKLRKSFPC